MTRLAALGALVASACSFSVAPPGTAGDDVVEGQLVTIVDDTAADFAAQAELRDGVIGARGVIEPAAFVVGGLHARGYAGNLLVDASTYDSIALETSSRSVLGEGYRHVPVDWTTLTPERPRGLGLTSDGNFTILYDGEILLPAGPVALAIEADDRALVQIALDATGFGPQLFAKQQVSTQTLDVPAAGWYPIRAAFSQGGGDARFRIAITPMFQTEIPVDAAWLRARVTDAPGLIVQAFIGQIFALPAGEAASPRIGAAYGAAAPALDLGQPADQFSLRFTGQLRIDEPGTYTFAGAVGTELSDGFRIWIDGEVVARRWAPQPEALVGTVDLAAGWHDLLVDFSEAEDSAQLAVSMAGPGIAEGPIDPTRLRPAIAFGLTASSLVLTATPLVDATLSGVMVVPGVTPIATPLAGPPGATIDALDFGFGIEDQRMSDLTVDRLDCLGSTPLTPLPAMPTYVYRSNDTTCADHPVTQLTWGFRIIDTVVGNDPLYAGDTPVVQFPLMAATYHGGDRTPFAPVVTYVSSPRPTPGATGYRPLALTADLRGGAITFELRAADDEAALATAAWVPVIDGEVPGAPLGELIQYRVTLSGDGWQFPTLDKVEITYLVGHDGG